MKPVLAAVLFFFIASSVKSYAQTDSSFLKKAVASADNNSKQNPAEKVYLHMDRPAYNITDTIWFKAYAVSGPMHQLSDISGVLHVELIGPTDSVVRRINLKLTNGVTWGDFALPKSYKTGAYRVRAYTNWMRNQGDAGFYEQRIRVSGRGAFGGSTQPATAASVNPDVQFFVEGGNLVNGLRSKMAVKAIGKNGLGQDIKGSVVDNDGNEVAGFSTTHLGMGVFALAPQAGKTYKAKITADGIPAFTINLPVAVGEGFTMAVNNRQADSISIKITASAQTLSSKQHSGYFLVGQSAGRVYYTTAFKLDDPAYMFTVEKKRFPSGIAQFTLFGPDGQPVNERVAFVRGNDTLKLALKIADQKFASRKKVSVGITAADDEGKPAIGAFSVSVINESHIAFDQNGESTILNNLLLTSDLKGNIEKPNYYFINISSETDADLDALMLTQGYRGFEWRKVLSAAPVINKYAAEQSLSLSGSLQTPGGKPLPNGKVSLFAGSEGLFADTVCDANGDFIFKDLDVSDTSHILVQGRKQSDGKNVSIFIKQDDLPKIDKLADADFAATGQNATGSQLAYQLQNQVQYREQQKIDSFKNVNALKEVIIKDKKPVVANSFNHYGTDQQLNVNMAKLKSYKESSLRDALAMAEPRAHLAVTAPIASNILNGNEQMIVDGVSTDVQQLSFYRVEEIESVKLIWRVDTSYKKPLIVITTTRYAGKDTTVLKEVKIHSTKTNKASYKGFSAGKIPPEQIIMGDKLSGCIKLSDCLSGKVFGVTFDVNGNPVDLRSNKKMGVILNGAVLDGSALNNVSATDVYSIEVLRGGSYAAFIGPDFPGGALAITTKTGEGSYVTGSSSSLGVITYPFKGFYKARTFYSPKYTTTNSTGEPDYRTTIYWEPNIVTDKTGKSSFEYFNADTKGIYRIVVEGIDAAGNLGRQVFRYQVN